VYATRPKNTPAPRTNLWLIGRAALKARNSTPENKASPKRRSTRATERNMLWVTPSLTGFSSGFEKVCRISDCGLGFLFGKLQLFLTSTVPDVMGVVEQAEGPTQKAQAHDVAVFARTLREEAGGILPEI
jgi:hypothetical protein